MPQQTPRSLQHFALFRFSKRYSSLPPAERRESGHRWLDSLKAASQRLQVYQVYPAQASADVLVWSALAAEEPCAAADFFRRFAQATNPQRGLFEPVQVLWGFTKPSQYTRSRSDQEMDPFAEQRRPYLVMYPFVKTTEWYRLSREARQGMMNEHVRIGRQYPQISQLLLYCFGIQDHEFIVVYETDDLLRFGDLVYELRDSDARTYTRQDTPIYTAIYHPPEETLALWE